MSLSEGEEIALTIISNISFMMGLCGLLMLVVTPLYAFKIIKRGDNPIKPVLVFSFGLAFLVQWLQGGS